jgi:hypothetical protein
MLNLHQNGAAAPVSGRRTDAINKPSECGLSNPIVALPACAQWQKQMLLSV